MMRVWVLVAVALALLLPVERVHTQTPQAGARRPVWPPKLDEPAPGEVEVLPVRGHVSVIMGSGPLQKGDRVRYAVRQSDRGPQADRVERL